jgi:hypothetical protein
VGVTSANGTDRRVARARGLRMTPRLATAGVFFVNGAGVGTLLAYVPFLRARLDVSKGVIGLCLLALALGALVAMPVAGQLLDRRPSRDLVRATVVAYPVALALPLLSASLLVLAGLLLVLGLANGALDVSQNAHGSAIERRLGRPIMSSLHAGWSRGGVVGAGGAALAAAGGLDPRIYAAAAAAALLLLGVALGRHLGDATAASHAGRPALPSRGVLALGLLCILVMLTEGAMNDWSALYLRTSLGAGADVAAAGLAAFSAGMALGRIGGDAATRRLGRAAVLRGGAGGWR